MIPLLWVDLETTGLDPHTGVVLEVGARLTDQLLNEVSRFHTIIHHDEKDLDELKDLFFPPAVVEMHTKNDLLRQVYESQVELAQAQASFATWLFENFKLGEKRPLAGSNPSFDRSWLNVHFEAAADFISYRSFDMNTVYYFAEVDKDKVKKKGIHRANADLDWDIAQLRVLKRLA
jgi:oligoribonuclease